MSYKAQPIYEGGSVAGSMAALCRQFNIDPDYLKLEVSIVEGKSVYHLHGRASALFSFDEKGHKYEEAETKVARALEQWRLHGVDNDAAPEDNRPKPVYVADCSVAQKEQIIRLLNHPLITRQEKTKMLLAINRLSKERADEAIAKLRTAIEDRKGTSAVAA